MSYYLDHSYVYWNRISSVNIQYFLLLHHQAILNSDENSHVLPNLDPDTEYSVTVTAIYPDESESEDLMGSERTCKQTAEPTSSVQRAKKSCFKLTDVTHVEIIMLSFSQRLFLVLKDVCKYVMWEGKVPFIVMFMILSGTVLWTMRDSVDRSTLFLS